MKNYLIHKFIQNSENVKDEKVRLSYGTLSSFVGMFCNILLFIMKIIVGFFSHSLSIVSDALNNLTDLVNNIITLFAYRIASKPADKEHPFGHGRMEYIIAFVIEIIMVVVTFEILISAIKRLTNPIPLNMHPTYLIVLILSILIKLWMYSFNRFIGEKINHYPIQAVAIDSRNDAIMTTITLISLIFAQFLPTLPIDSILSILLSCWILYAVFKMLKEVVDKLLGNPVNLPVQKEIEEHIKKTKDILGVHDFLLHDYGPSRQIASIHVEMPSSLSLEEAHQTIDQIEKEVLENYGIQLTIHIDPIKNTDETIQLKEQLKDILKEKSPLLSFHDFQVHEGICQFDLLVPDELNLSNEELYEYIQEKMKPYKCDITFDHQYISERVSS